MASDEKTRFLIEIEMQDRWIPHFLSMLKHMEYLGGIGSSRMTHFFSDGDGDFRPKFNWTIGAELAKPVRSENNENTYDAG